MTRSLSKDNIKTYLLSIAKKICPTFAPFLNHDIENI